MLVELGRRGRSSGRPASSRRVPCGGAARRAGPIPHPCRESSRRTSRSPAGRSRSGSNPALMISSREGRPLDSHEGVFDQLRHVGHLFAVSLHPGGVAPVGVVGLVRLVRRMRIEDVEIREERHVAVPSTQVTSRSTYSRALLLRERRTHAVEASRFRGAPRTPDAGSCSAR